VATSSAAIYGETCGRVQAFSVCGFMSLATSL
jgi:hypothetical protein